MQLILPVIILLSFANFAEAQETDPVQIAKVIGHPGGNKYPSDITIFGLDWSMSGLEMIRLVNSRGYSCAVYEASDLFCRRQDNRNISISISSHSIKFPCETFSMCDQEVEAIAQQLVDSKDLDVMEFNRKIQGYNMPAYCGKSPEGNFVCVSSFLFGPQINFFRGDKEKTLEFD